MVKAYKTDENGHEQIVSFLKTGDMFPHTGFLTHPYPATAEAITPTELLAIPVRLF
ncbi:cyclic nucleotide-binding domain-containing protein [Paenibacillus amylolyticus]|nr:cyclic nucleotide-binding domain-containing protein [Paenibacillus amylolyticus]